MKTIPERAKHLRLGSEGEEVEGGFLSWARMVSLGRMTASSPVVTGRNEWLWGAVLATVNKFSDCPNHFLL